MATKSTKATIDAVLAVHHVVGTSGFGVEQIMCDCRHTVWFTDDEYNKHLSEKLVAALNPAPPIRLVRVEETIATTEWRAWDEAGAKYYLRFRAGHGTVTRWGGPDKPDTLVSEFQHRGRTQTVLDEFAKLAGIDVSQIPEADR